MRTAACCSLLLLAAAAFASPARFVADPVLEITFDAAPVALIDVREPEITDALPGLCILPDGVVLFDRVTTQVLGYAADGAERFAFGTLGTGPEDFSESCRPLRWHDGSLALVDLGIPPKVILLEPDGAFRTSFSLDTTHGLTNPRRLGDGLVGLEYSFRMEDDATKVILAVTAYDRGGAETWRHELPTREIVFGDPAERTLRKMEIFPALRASGDRVCVQIDPYVLDILCFDISGTLLWHLDEDVTLASRQPSADDRGLMDLPSSTEHHALRGLWVRPDGEVWLERETGEAAGEVRRFRRLAPDGSAAGTAEVTGLPTGRGDLDFQDDVLLWSDLQRDVVEAPVLKVFRLRAGG